MNDMLKVLKEMQDDHGIELRLHTKRRDGWVEGCSEYNHHDIWVCDTKERLAALDKAIAIITETDALLPVLQQMAHSVALGDVGDGALKRLIAALYSKECPVCGSTEAGHVCDFV